MARGRNMLVRVARVVWLAAALGFIGWFLATRWEEALGHLAALSPWQPFAAFALLMAAKFAYVEVVRRGLEAVGGQGGWRLALAAYGLSGLGKYVPGSIWQFVGRFDIYRSRGVGTQQAIGLIMLENAVMLVVAALVALIAAPVFFAIALEWVSLPLLAAAAAALALAALAGLVHPAVRARLEPIAYAGLRRRGLIVSMAGLFLAMWLLIGLSAWVLIAFGAESGIRLAPFVIGLFALSYVAGFVTVFAPAGVGVREAVFTIGLAGILPVEAALVVAVGHRIIYLLSDAVLGLMGWVSYAQLGRSSSD